ncbi:MAG: DUF2961 domain-containing protein [Tepidisphaerales bacterium]
MRTSIATVILLVIAGTVSAAENALTYPDLVKRVTDLEYLATLPAPGETCAQWSSYDRASKYDAATGKYINWDANGDGDGYIRKEGDTFVMAEMEGPGCIWRIWSARPEKGHVRIYLDGAAEPAVDLPFIGYFDHKNEPFTDKTLVHNVSNGENNYVPIPYQKSCKIVADKGWGQYFHFTYGTFPKGTQVPTFKRQLSAEDTAALAAADKTLASCGPERVVTRNGQATESKSVTVAAGQSATVATLAGPQAITALRVKLDLPKSPDDRVALRELVLKITWDDDAAPAVWVPLGDFFGTAAGANKYRSLPLGLTDDGTWYSQWYMPFAKAAKIELINDGKEQKAVAFEITHAPLTRPIDTLGRFHAKWHRDIFLPAEKERQIDWPMLVTQGRGRFVGVMLHVWSPKGGWWGEGDEKFFVDGEKFPSTFGTGSEDYFGYAWSSPKLFQHALHNQTISQNLKGHISVNRWQIAENVPFQKSFEACIEKYYPNKRPCLYAAVPYFYLAAGDKDGYQSATLEERTGYWETVPTARIPGVIEAEDMKILGKTAGNAGTQEMSYDTGAWSGDAQLWWTGAKPGDKLDLALPVAKAGSQKIILQLTKARDYGIVQVSLDGQKLGNPIDLYNPAVVPFGPVSLGPVDLTAGEHKLTFEITGANDKAIKAYMVGIDYVKVEAQ